MRRLAGLLVIACLALPFSAQAKPAAHAPRGGIGSDLRFGLGLGLGDPTSLTGKYFLDRSRALDFGLDFNPGGAGLHGDLLFNLAELANTRDLSLQFYLGVGAQFAAGHPHWYYDWGHDRGNLAVRVPVGLAMWLNRAPLEFYFELGPEVWLLEPFGSVFSTVGFRVYF